MLGCAKPKTAITLNTFTVEARVQSQGLQCEIYCCDPFLWKLFCVPHAFRVSQLKDVGGYGNSYTWRYFHSTQYTSEIFKYGQHNEEFQDTWQTQVKRTNIFILLISKFQHDIYITSFLLVKPMTWPYIYIYIHTGMPRIRWLSICGFSYPHFSKRPPSGNGL
jgi:hypothetical protein